jgi:putative protease
MAISCPRCGAGYDVTLFQFGHGIRCDCGAEVRYPGEGLRGGHVQPDASQPAEGSAMSEIEIGKVTHYFSKIGVAAIEITHDVLRVGDTIHVKGHTSDFTQKVDSMQLDNQAVQAATVGQSVGFKVVDHARQHDAVYKVVE